MYQKVYGPVADSLGLTSLLAAPLTLMFVMLGVFKRSPQLSALVSLAATVAVATLVYPMPFSAALNSGLSESAPAPRVRPRPAKFILILTLARTWWT